VLLIRDGVPSSYLVTGKHLVAENGTMHSAHKGFREASWLSISGLDAPLETKWALWGTASVPIVKSIIRKSTGASAAWLNILYRQKTFICKETILFHWAAFWSQSVFFRTTQQFFSKDVRFWKRRLQNYSFLRHEAVYCGRYVQVVCGKLVPLSSEQLWRQVSQIFY
jgi:hypothetical protein